MKCPTCTETSLIMAERQGVEIDYCPACRGIWLDRGELDKLLDRAVAATQAPTLSSTQVPQPTRGQVQSEAFAEGRYGHDHQAHYKRKKSWLHDIFD